MLEYLDRRGTGCHRYDAPEALSAQYPLTIADMDIAAPRCVARAIEQRAQHHAYGYAYVGQEYYDAVVEWFSTQHGWHINAGHIVYTTGVVPALSAAIGALALPSQAVLTHMPAYNCFFSSIRNMGCRLVGHMLRNDNGHYSIDFDALEQQIESDEQVRLMLLCNPHNPTGRVWTADELAALVKICKRHNLWLLSDEIHCEFAQPHHPYTPLATVADGLYDRYVVFTSPSKAFNIAGLQVANIICHNDEARRQIDRMVNIHENCDLNVFGPVALCAAYSAEGALWLKELNALFAQNYATLSAALQHTAARLTPLEGTYLAWIDIRAYGITSEAMVEKISARSSVLLSPGTLYGAGGEGFLRLNMACSPSVMATVAQRLAACLATEAR